MPYTPQPSQSTLLRGPAKFFGVPIEQVDKVNKVPVVMEHTIKYLQENGVEEEG